MGTGCAFISDKHEAWRLDPDEDGVDISSDCDDSDGDLGLPVEWYLDQDEDGFGAVEDMKRQCKKPPGYVRNADDCNDTNPDVYPSAEEVCDLIDNNCDEQIDEGTTKIYAFTDSDGDGYGDPATEMLVCTFADGQVENGEDCDDTDPAWQIAQPIEEFYNGLDDNCDASDLDGDQDADGFWLADYGARVLENGGEPMLVDPAKEGDCKDDDASVHPGAIDEPYDGIDTDCAGDDDFDQDGDGYVPDEFVGLVTEGMEDTDLLPGGDCNDYMDTVHPEASEDCSTTYDDDCDGVSSAVDAPDCVDFFKDYDGDGYGGEESRCQCEPDFEYQLDTSDDCNDFDPDIHPEAFDEPYDGVDADCAGDDDFDEDDDGFVADEHVGMPTLGVDGTGLLPGGDCDDLDVLVHAGAEETCETVWDDDCDGTNNAEGAAGCTDFFTDFDGDGYGDDALTGCWCHPTTEYTTALSGDCHDSNPLVNPNAIDVPYDAVDTDCAEDDDFDADGDGYVRLGFEDTPTLMFEGGSATEIPSLLPGGDCDDAEPLIFPGAEEICDALDNDCDDEIDEEGAVGALVLYLDEDEDGYGVESSTIMACSSELYAAVAGDCDDADGSIFPGAEETCDNVDDDCDGDLVGSFLDSDLDGEPDCMDPPMMAELATVLFQGVSSTATGSSLHIDEMGRLAIGAPLASEEKSRVYVLSELGTGMVSLETETALLSPNRDDLTTGEVDFVPTGFGRQIVSMPDLVGDGTALVVSAPYDSGFMVLENPDIGRAVTWPTTSAEVETWVLEDSVPGTTAGNCGSSMASGLFSIGEGSVAGPGVAVGCPSEFPAVYVVGQDSWTASVDNLLSDGARLGTESEVVESFGETLAIGDFNADGRDDVVVGAPRGDFECTPGNCGSVHVFFGPHEDETPISRSDMTILGGSRNDMLGHHILGGNDLDGDGVDDLLVASDRGWSREADPKRGSLLLYVGPVLASTSVDSLAEEDAYLELKGTDLDAYFGAAVGVVPDIDGDLSPELIIGAPRSSAAGTLGGAVYGLMGPWEPGTYDAPPIARALYGTSLEALGGTIVVGDVGSDGILDVIVGSSGSSKVYGLHVEDWLLD